MPSPELQLLRSLLAANELTPDSPVADWRTAIDGIGTLVPPATGVVTEVVDAGGRPAEVHRPAAGAPVRAILLLHGGGYAIGGPASHRPLATHLAAAADATVVVLDYRLAPEHGCPAALDDAAAAWEWLLARDEVAPATAAVVGDSAGGGLALALLTRLAAERGPLPGAVALLSPWVDLRGTAPSLTGNDPTDVVLSPALLERWAAWYRGDLPADDPRVSPMLGELSGLPPTLVIATDTEILLDDATGVTAALGQAGVDAHLEVHADLFHDWPMYAGMLPEADAAVARVAEFLRSLR